MQCTQLEKFPANSCNKILKRNIVLFFPNKKIFPNPKIPLPVWYRNKSLLLSKLYLKPRHNKYKISLKVSASYVFMGSNHTYQIKHPVLAVYCAYVAKCTLDDPP